MRTRKWAIEYVASALWDRASMEGMDEACWIFQQVNDDEGFIIDYMPRGIPRGHWLRVKGVRLTPREMARAIALAKEWH
jgi:hypothetical protein